MLSYEEARQKVIEIAEALVRAHPAGIEHTDLNAALGRVLAADIAADRDYPPFNRSTRDGFAVRSSDVESVPKRVRLIGESKAGTAFGGQVAAGECVQIMTGAPLPPGADAVVMLEHVRSANGEVLVERAIQPGLNVVASGSEAKCGQVVLTRGTRLGYAELAMAAQVGYANVAVFARPKVAVLSTGDEVVAVDHRPGPFEIRNSNGVSLAAQASLAGAAPVPLGNAPDRVPELRALIEEGLRSDILVLSGGVSMGKYDLVEGVLRELGAEFFFDAVAIRPGRPAVFGRCRDKLVFGLPGTPVSTMVTFELFVVPAVELLSGVEARPLPFFKAKLATPVEQKAKLTHFLPARVSWPEGEPTVEELPWQGSGDIVALAKANCFLVVPETKLHLAAGDWVNVLPRRGTL
jgi:molybdopterin molybdotransferase